MYLQFKTFKCLITISVLAIFLCSCASQKLSVQGFKTANVTSMYLDGTSFYNAYEHSSFILFGFKDNGNDNYDITANSVTGIDIDAKLNLQSTGQTTPVNSNDDFSLLPSKVSRKNITKFIKRLKRKDDIDFKTQYSHYIVNFKAQGIGGHGKNKYLKIGICVDTTTNGNCAFKTKLNSNPCPPCRNRYSSY